jgi:2'-5' RNA ligase
MAPARRLFVGLALPPDVAGPAERATEIALAGPAGEGLRRIRAEEMHLTLHFLGATDETRIEGLVRELSRRIDGAPPPRLVVDRAGAFPSPERPRVLWLGVSEAPGTGGRLLALQRASVEACRAQGLPVREEAWHPHVTVARPIGDRRAPIPGAFRDLAIDLAFEPAEAALFESRPGATGADRYPALATFEFGRNPV